MGKGLFTDTKSGTRWESIYVQTKKVGQGGTRWESVYLKTQKVGQDGTRWESGCIFFYKVEMGQPETERNG